jgi:AraC-like DNA-binding protein
MSDKELMEDIESVEEMVVDPDPEEEEEAHDESEAEADEEVSEAAAAPEVDGEKAAEDDAAKIKKSAPSQAKVPGGAATKGDPMPSTKAGMINAMYNEMSKMKKADLSASYNKMMNAMKHGMKEDTEVEEVTPELHEKAAKVTVDVTADMNALAESEATLSETFKDKAAVIMEAAVKSKVSEEVARIESELQEEFDEELKTTREEMVEQIDGYLNYVVEKFMEENKLAIEHGLRTELAEDFMNGLKNLFTESYVEVPESKVDLVDELGTQVRELEEKLNETTEASIRMTGELEELKRDAIIREHSRDLAETQVEKLKSLAEDIDFEDEETFASKVATIKESYFTKKKVTVAEEQVDESAEEQEVSGSMAMYVNALKQTHKPQ